MAYLDFDHFVRKPSSSEIGNWRRKCYNAENRLSLDEGWGYCMEIYKKNSKYNFVILKQSAWRISSF